MTDHFQLCNGCAYDEALEMDQDYYECETCHAPVPESGTILHAGGHYPYVCQDCVDAYEREDAPWELAVTLGDIDPKHEPFPPMTDKEYFDRFIR